MAPSEDFLQCLKALQLFFYNNGLFCSYLFIYSCHPLFQQSCLFAQYALGNVHQWDAGAAATPHAGCSCWLKRFSFFPFEGTQPDSEVPVKEII